MRGFVISKYAHPRDISLTLDAREPRPGSGEVLIDVYSAGLNFFDVSTSVHASTHDLNLSLRFYKPRANIKINHHFHLFWEQNWPARSPILHRYLKVARLNLGTVSLVLCKGLSQIEYVLIGWY